MAKGIQSIDIAFGVLHALQHSTGPMLLKDIAARTGMSASKARMYLVSLLRTGLVSQNASSAYTLGPAALNLGLAAFKQIDLMDTTRRLLTSLTEETQAPTMLNIWAGTSIRIIARNDSAGDLPIHFRIGGTAALTNTATGRVFMAYLPAGVVMPYVQSELANKPATGEDAVTMEALEQRVHAIRERGYDMSPDVVLTTDPHITLQGYGAIAVPVVDISQELRFVITVLYRKTSDTREADTIASILEKIRDAIPTPVLPPVRAS
ncbi:MAG TPA: IclR family transcriptional regulator [Eoetvoesiella sp.]|uniref:IclR family transcriptional regulator n=1 Tax=Eoetvoesiella sp. TaxID=1966355 RepID=UPI002C133BCA|nr:IclR family transcriptional regulator [Eoetvoesiella sp.]HWK59820.1 IclR family transcriptional regulator [Eoetvoesiella sp.]